jgi:chemotaxis protein CheD
MISAPRVLPELSLQPGDLYLARNPTILHTILGSCVSVAFWSARLGAGALNHGILPRGPEVWPRETHLTDTFRYVDFSIRHLARQLDALGVPRRELQVKVFGGADVLQVAIDRARATVGALNCQTALDILAAEGFIVAASDLGGTRGRKISFHTGTGEVPVQKLDPWNAGSRERVASANCWVPPKRTP